MLPDADAGYNLKNDQNACCVCKQLQYQLLYTDHELKGMENNYTQDWELMCNEQQKCRGELCHPGIAEESDDALRRRRDHDICERRGAEVVQRS